MNETRLIKEVTDAFRTFGGEAVRDPSNPVTLAMAGKPPMFAMGVDVGDVVRFVLSRADTISREPPESHWQHLEPPPA